MNKKYQTPSCAVATRLVERIYRFLKTGLPYVLRDRDGVAITVEQARQIVTANSTVPVEVRQSRRKHVPLLEAPAH